VSGARVGASLGAITFSLPNMQHAQHAARKKTRQEILEERRRSLQQRTGFGAGLWGEAPPAGVDTAVRRPLAVFQPRRPPPDAVQLPPHVPEDDIVASVAAPTCRRHEIAMDKLSALPFDASSHAQALLSSVPQVRGSRRSLLPDTPRSGGSSFYSEDPEGVGSGSPFVSPSMVDFKDRARFADADAIIARNSPQNSPSKPAATSTPERAARARQRVQRAAADNQRAFRWIAQRQSTEHGLAIHPATIEVLSDSVHAIDDEVTQLTHEIADLEGAILRRTSSRRRRERVTSPGQGGG
jgi:hypothetical protein